MTAAADAVAALLAELVRHGIELRAAGERLRYRPRSAMTPSLMVKVRAHRAELLAILVASEAPDLQDARVLTAMSASPSADTFDRARAPHELSLDERVEAGYVNHGWAPEAWADRLRQLADRCEALHPGLAVQYRAWAAKVLKNRRRFA